MITRLYNTNAAMVEHISSSHSATHRGPRVKLAGCHILANMQCRHFEPIHLRDKLQCRGSLIFLNGHCIEMFLSKFKYQKEDFGLFFGASRCSFKVTLSNSNSE